MKIKILFLIIAIFIISSQGYSHVPFGVSQQPDEVIILKLPNQGYLNWKEIGRSVTEKQGIVELIPLNQSSKNWTELIRIQYFSRSIGKGKSATSVEKVLETIQEEDRVINSGTSSYKIIEKNERDIIYEVIMPQLNEHLPLQHEIARVFLTDSGIHCVAFCRQYALMTAEEKLKWINQFKDLAAVVPLKEAIKASTALTMADKVKNSLNLGPTFQTWSVLTTYSFDVGCTLVGWIPETQPETYKDQSYVTEILEVTTMPNLNGATIDKYFEADRRAVQKQSIGRIAFYVLKKTPTEIIYHYSAPKDHLQLTAIVRTFIADQGWYSISYRRGLPEALKQEDILKWQEKLEAIQVQNHL